MIYGLAAVLLSVAVVCPGLAQVRTIDDTAGVRVAVLNTVLASRADLLDGSRTVIASCSLHGAEHNLPARANIEERFRKALVSPAGRDSAERAGQCDMEDFADRAGVVLFFEEPRAITGTSDHEVVLWRIVGRGYVEQILYTVYPRGFVTYGGSRPGTRYAGFAIKAFRLGEVRYDWTRDTVVVRRGNS